MFIQYMYLCACVGEEGLSDLLCDHHEISELLEETYTEYQKHTRMLASRVNPPTYT